MKHLLTIKSPAKINLGLNIVEKRQDGFHNIETVFYPVSLSDKISFYESDNYSLTSNDQTLQVDDSNLITKAIKLLEELSSKEIKLNIHLEKIIPMGAGLGGGSSNAASVMVALNSLLKLNIPLEILEDKSLQLGSDVPFFIYKNPCFAYSRGEKIEPIKLKIKAYILLIYPQVNVSTKWAYTNCVPKKSEVDLKNFIQKNDLSLWKKHVVNDFEDVVFSEYPLIKEIKNRLYTNGAIFSLMSGSGSTIYGIFNKEADAHIAQKEFSNKYFTYIHHED